MKSNDEVTLGWGKFYRALDGWLPDVDKGKDEDCYESPTRKALLSATTIVSLAILINTQPVADRLVPDGNGGVAFEYWNDEDGFKTMHIDRDGKIRCREYDAAGNVIVDTLAS